MIVYKMARPLAAGDLWDAVQDDPRLVVIVNADDLRYAGVNISRRLSWERTAEDFASELASVGNLVSLLSCRNLIVRFGCEGAIHHRGWDGSALYFDPGRVEGEFTPGRNGGMIGFSSAFTAGIAASLYKSGNDGRAIPDGIQHGIPPPQACARRGYKGQGKKGRRTRQA
jgi:hypothetical protein